MTIDFLILVLLLISFAINLLALGAFCMTPCLRTTAGRFVINLLIINLAGCCLLGATLFFIGKASATAHTHNIVYSLDIISKDINSDHNTPKKRALHQENEFLNEIKQTENIFKYFEKLTIKDKLIQDDEKLYNHSAVNPIFDTSGENRKVKSTEFMRLWSIDLAAALGGLSVLVVVGDTWMAVKDPMRYRRRVSKENAWIMIVLNWVLGILFGIMSAYWQLDFEEIGKKKNSFSEHIQVLSLTFNIIFSKTFAYFYFVVIILLPFGFVCGMYWRIFSEARGLRKRTSIPSPLLKLVTNLSRIQEDQRKRVSLENENGLRLVEVDNNESSLEENKIESHTKLLEETTVEEIKSNKPLLNCSSDSDGSNTHNSLRPFLRLQAVRQIYSTPNLQKYSQGHGSFWTGFETTSNFHYMSYQHQALQIHNNHMSPHSISCMTLIRQRISHASEFLRHREESRAARISILVVLMFLVSYLPYGFLGLLHGSQMIKNCPYSTQLAVFMVLLANLSSPFIFAYRNKHVRHGVTRLIGFNNRSKNNFLHHKCIFLRLVTKVSISIKRNSSKLSRYSCKYLTQIYKHSRESLDGTKYDINTVEKYLTNSASIQSSEMFGNITVFNAVIDIELEQAQENV